MEVIEVRHVGERMPVPTTASETVSIIIPWWRGNLRTVLESIAQQTFTDYRVYLALRIPKPARARNRGVAAARGELLLFLDDDATLGHPEVLATLVAAVRADPQIGVAGPAKILSPDATPFQRRVAREVPRWVYPVRPEDTESNPPLDRYGYTGITTTCALIPRTVFTHIGTFDEALTTAEDTDFFYRARRAGYRFVVPADCWVYHNPPATLPALLRKGFAYGMNHAWEAARAPERRMAIVPLDHWYGHVLLVLSPLLFPLSLFIHLYFDPTRRLRFGFRPLKTLSTYATLYGYAWGWYRPPDEVETRRGFVTDQQPGETEHEAR